MCVRVLTPTLNKSFKFQSDWPYNNSQVYLLQTLLSDIQKIIGEPLEDIISLEIGESDPEQNKTQQ